MPITATMVVTSTPTPTLASATATPTSKSSSSSAGPIIGIVAGSLVGVVVLSGLVGFLFKKYNKKTDPYEANPFDRDDFQRHSTMIPDHFDSDDGHGGMSPSGPEMSEQHHYNNFGGPHYESGISAGMMGAGVGAATAGAGTAVALAHNEGGPRPPTMFARHAAHQQTQQAPQVGGYYKDGDYSHMASVSPQDQYAAPPSAAFANHSVGGYLEDPRGLHQQRSISPAPQLPPLAAFGGDPYSIAGVGRGQQGHNAAANNVANPYAHLDRAQPGQYVPGAPLHVAQQRDSGSVVSSDHHGDQRHASVAAAEALAAGLAHQSSLNRSASPYGNANYGNSQADFDTAGRPGTSEGRSGTPDIPNVQQTYAVGNNASSHGSVGSSDATSSTGSVNNQIINPFDPSPQHHHNPHQFHHTTQAHLQQQQEHDTSNHLSVRNLVPNHAVGSAGQRPISTASSFADPEDAYGGVY
ncbi:hypothetical protein BCV70DRAFT_197759 [Testicularia cyperi]|uniref:Uncharacterized protein n=1 Tax=Testicularia cyperi TaxID=1882483 RepID=A0A317XZ27_9BASI|nr:hypothetical protein BCV70DRAFT_197759 [Testicularia cyperi]